MIAVYNGDKSRRHLTGRLFQRIDMDKFLFFIAVFRFSVDGNRYGIGRAHIGFYVQPVLFQIGTVHFIFHEISKWRKIIQRFIIRLFCII